ncbi:MAG: helix-turn-helix domain-containing protein [Alphaproteobacteria bacterium]|nr:helix-turn-helix domain-containing protein [Alphaproteobacteria bacterium]
MGKGPNRISNTIREQRFHAGEMTQAELAEAVGITRQTVIAMEQGRYSPSLEVAFRVARTFGKPLEEVFQYED